MHKDSCPQYKELKCREERSEPFGDILEELKGAVCNKNEKRICCSPQEDQNFKCYESAAQIPEEIPEEEITVKDVIGQVSPADNRIAANLLKDGMADFTQSMYLHLAQQPHLTNFVFSPLSLHSSLSMLYLGTTHGSNAARTTPTARSD